MAVRIPKQTGEAVASPVPFNEPVPGGEETPAIIPAEEPVKPKKLKTAAVLEHPDNTAAHSLQGAYYVQVSGRQVKLEMERGRIKTDSLEIAKALIASGFRLHTRLEE